MHTIPDKGDRVSYTAVYNTKPDTRYETHYGRVTSVQYPDTGAATARIAVENPRPHETRYVTRNLANIDLAPLDPAARVAEPVTVLVTNFELMRALDGHAQTFAASDGQQVIIRLYGVDELLAAQREAAASLPGPDPGMSRTQATQLCRPLDVEAIARRAALR